MPFKSVFSSDSIWQDGFVPFTNFIQLYCNSAWVNLISDEHWGNSVACIGGTTASAAKRLGLRNVYFPENPGLDGYSLLSLAIFWLSDQI